MLASTAVTIALMGCLLHANGAATNAKRADVSYIDKYDLFGITVQFIALTQDKEGALTYDGFQYVSPGGLLAEVAYVGVAPASKPNVGVMANNGTLSAPKGSLATIHNFRFGCVARSLYPAAEVPIPCVLTVTSVKRGDEDGEFDPVKSQPYTYLPKPDLKPKDPLKPLSLNAPMTTAAVQFPPAIAYQLSVRSAIEPPGTILDFVPEDLREAVRKLFRDVGDYAIGVRIDDLSYTITTPSP